jgi:hypothetical protein
MPSLNRSTVAHWMFARTLRKWGWSSVRFLRPQQTKKTRHDVFSECIRGVETGADTDVPDLFRRGADQAENAGQSNPAYSGASDTANPGTIDDATLKRTAKAWLDSARKPRSLRRVRRSAVASRSEELRFLLQPGSDASLIGQECAGLSAPAEARPRRSHLNSGWAASPICLGLGFN